MKKYFKLIKFYLENKTKEEIFPTSIEAFGLSRYCDKKQISIDDLRKNLIKSIEKEILDRLKYRGTYSGMDRYVYTRLISEYREKIVLSEIKKYFQEVKGYDVEILNDSRFEYINVLIISWQNREKYLIKDKIEEPQ